MLPRIYRCENDTQRNNLRKDGMHLSIICVGVIVYDSVGIMLRLPSEPRDIVIPGSETFGKRSSRLASPGNKVIRSSLKPALVLRFPIAIILESLQQLSLFSLEFLKPSADKEPSQQEQRSNCRLVNNRNYQLVMHVHGQATSIQRLPAHLPLGTSVAAAPSPTTRSGIAPAGSSSWRSRKTQTRRSSAADGRLSPTTLGSRPPVVPAANLTAKATSGRHAKLLICRWLRWWSRTGSNRRPLECHSSALPTELRPH
jgi:hypothetical protein